MGIGVSLILIAAGAVLVWGINGDIGSVNEDAIGWILMIVGAIGLLISLFFLGSMRRGPTERTVVRDREPY